MSISIINYGVGNIASIVNMLKRIGVASNVVSTGEELRTAQKLILPGVGSFDTAMKKLNSAPGLREELDVAALDRKVPLLGICLGMQLLLDGSDEGSERGLGYLGGVSRKFNATEFSKVPHMGWNKINVVRNHYTLTQIEQSSRFYFVHSYFVELVSALDGICKTTHGHEFWSGVSRSNITGFQFHPEKSHKFGMGILKNFAQNAN